MPERKGTYAVFNEPRDEIIAVFEKKDSSYLLLGNKKEKMPIGFQTLENWLKRRNSASHNGYLYSLLEKCGCNNENEFLSLTHAASLNDTFWVSNGTELLGWDDVSPLSEFLQRAGLETGV